MSEVGAQQALQTHICKFGECTNEVSSRIGRYAYCEVHRTPEGRGLNVVPGDGPPEPSRAGGRRKPAPGTAVAKLTGLVDDAKAVDKAKAKAAKLTERALKAKRDADAAERAFKAKLRDEVAE